MLSYFSDISATTWLTTAAIVIGPISAVQIEKWLEVRREATRRRLELFRTLMLHRAAPLAPDNVAALNSIELVFSGKQFQDVRARWKTLLSHFNDHPRAELPNFREALIVWRSKTNDLTSNLLQEMGERLGFDFDDVEIQKGTYFPQAFVDQEAANNIIRDGVVKIIMGQDQLNVRVAMDDEHRGQSR